MCNAHNHAGGLVLITSHLTHSRMMTYDQCPKKYFYEYVLKLKAEPQYPAYGDLGSRAHKVLEDFYRYVTIPCDPEPHFNDLLGRLYVHEFADTEDYKFNMHRGLLIFLDMEIERYNDLEDKELFIPKYNELYLKSKIGDVPFSGRIDAIYEELDGLLLGVDYKFTSKNSVGKEQKQQACIYAILLEKELGITFNEFAFWFLRHKNKAIKTVKITNKLISDVHQKVYNALQEIERMNFQCKQSWLCRYCGYESICLEEQAGIK